MTRRILFFGKRDDEHCMRAIDYIERSCTSVTVYLSDWDDVIPYEALEWKGDFIISYLSRWILPSRLLKKAKIAAINFHPASPKYPGIGCNNFALYEGEKNYGVTCHHMDKKVDTGKIIAVKYFPIFPNDNVGSLLLRSYDYQLVLFYEIVGLLLQGLELPVSNSKWSRKPFTRKEFNELFIINSAMGKEEVDKRIRATSYKQLKSTIEVAGHIFELKTKENNW